MKVSDKKLLEIFQRYPAIESVNLGKIIKVIIDGQSLPLAELPNAMRLDILRVLNGTQNRQK